MSHGFIIVLLAGSGCAQAAKVPAFTMEGEGADKVKAYIGQEGGVSRWFPNVKNCNLYRIEPTPLIEPLAPNVSELTASWACERVASPLRVSFKVTDGEVGAAFPHYEK
jgi:hypothetical protein